MGSPPTDVLAAATAAASIFFGLRAVRSDARSDRAGFGLAFGVALGTKLTLFFLLPGLALALLVAAFAEDRALAPRRLARAGGAALAGFLALGAYNYVLNLAELGNPIASVRARAVALGGRAVPELATRRTNFLRYGYQILDWPGLARGEGSLLPRLQRRVELVFLPQRERGAQRFHPAGAGRVGQAGGGKADAGFEAALRFPAFVNAEQEAGAERVP